MVQIHERAEDSDRNKKIGGETKKMNTQKKCTGIILAAIMVASIFAMGVTMVSAVDPSGADVAVNVTKSTKPAGSAGTNTADGGYITGLNLSANTQTAKWQGYYGNVSGGIVLRDGDSDSMYEWSVSAPAGEVLACSGTPTWSGLVVATVANLDTACSFGTDADNAANTFNDGTGQVVVAGLTIGSVYRAQTEGTGPYYTYLLNYNSNSQVWTDFVFVAPINNDATNFKSTHSDYQMIVPETEASATTTSYNFYLEL